MEEKKQNKLTGKQLAMIGSVSVVVLAAVVILCGKLFAMVLSGAERAEAEKDTVSAEAEELIAPEDAEVTFDPANISELFTFEEMEPTGNMDGDKTRDENGYETEYEGIMNGSEENYIEDGTGFQWANEAGNESGEAPSGGANGEIAYGSRDNEVKKTAEGSLNAEPSGTVSGETSGQQINPITIPKADPEPEKEPLPRPIHKEEQTPAEPEKEAVPEYVPAENETIILR